ncbi:MAG: hypothetical protein OXN25_04970 [Candidatus Poribacteria bacterium]|nr:hypothetical protein [Candidatus Poribacteria bacterium]
MKLFLHKCVAAILILVIGFISVNVLIGTTEACPEAEEICDTLAEAAANRCAEPDTSTTQCLKYWGAAIAGCAAAMYLLCSSS